MLFVCIGFHGTSTVKNLTVKPQRIHSNVYNSLRQKLQANFKSVRLFVLVVLKVLDPARPLSSSLFLYNVRIVGALARSW
jgi:hypothetical protein